MGLSHNKDFFYYEKSYNIKEILTRKNNKFLWITKNNNDVLISSNNVNVSIESNVDISRKYIYKRLLCLYCESVLNKNSDLSDSNKEYINKKINEYNKYQDKFLKNKKFIHYYIDKKQKIFYEVMVPQCSYYTKYIIKFSNNDIKYFYISKEATKNYN